MRVYDQDEEFEDDENTFDLDDSQLFCPRCGAQHTVKVTRWPQPGTWMNLRGTAFCGECSIEFEICLELEEEQRSRHEIDIYERNTKLPSWYGRQRR